MKKLFVEHDGNVFMLNLNYPLIPMAAANSLCPFLGSLPFLSLHVNFAAIRDGYRLEFDSKPPPPLLPNNRSARERPDFVLAELARLEKMGCILKVNDRPRVVNPMSVVCKFFILDLLVC